MGRLFLLLLSSVLILQSYAQNIEKYEALMIINFVKYTEWASPESEVRIGILGNSRVLSELDSYIKKGGYNYSVAKVSYIDQVKNYHVVFIPRSQNKSIDEVLNRTAESKIMLISEDTSISSKVIFSFFMEGNKLRYSFNQQLADAKGWEVGSKVLQFAKSTN